MTRRLLLTMFVLALAGTSIASDDRFKVIVNPENPATAIDREFLRDAYLRKAAEWSDGETIRPVDLADKFPSRERFNEDVVRKTAAQLKAYWNQQIFSGKGVPPPEADTTAEMIDYVLAHRGAVGYLPVDVDPGHAKVVPVK